ncbi:MAG: hypothetical protein V1793_16330 [Pseudomonadota bacterium]
MDKGKFMDQDRDQDRKTKKSKFREYYDEDFSLEDEEGLQHRKKKSSKRSHRPKEIKDEFDPGFEDTKKFVPGGGGDPGKKTRH